MTDVPPDVAVRVTFGRSGGSGTAWRPSPGVRQVLPPPTGRCGLVAERAGFVAVASTEEAGLTQIARYVAEQAQWQLWPPAVRRVSALLESGDPAGAVKEYFRHVGERWEAEWLTTTRLGLDAGSGVWSGSLPLYVSPPARLPNGKGE